MKRPACKRYPKIFQVSTLNSIYLPANLPRVPYFPATFGETSIFMELEDARETRSQDEG